MNEEQKQRYYEKYQQAKQKGTKFFPDVIYKDTLMMLAIFVALVMLATFIGVANEPKADPSDSAYIPRPEWYFLFLFEMLKYFPGQLEWIGTFIIPSLAVAALFLLPFIDRNPYRHFSKRKFALGFMSVRRKPRPWQPHCRSRYWLGRICTPSIAWSATAWRAKEVRSRG